jgi:DNA topoisomerase-3
MVQICDRVKSKEDMLQESIHKYKEVFLLARGDFERVVQVSDIRALWPVLTRQQSVRHYIQGAGQPQGDANRGGNAARGRGGAPRAAGRVAGPRGNDSDDGSPFYS